MVYLLYSDIDKDKDAELLKMERVNGKEGGQSGRISLIPL